MSAQAEDHADYPTVQRAICDQLNCTPTHGRDPEFWTCAVLTKTAVEALGGLSAEYVEVSR